jgi:shikimate kinase
MKSKENLVFLGMMGSGKSSIGFIVSKKLKYDFFDVDQEIEKKLGNKISNIFKTKGESYFREVEEKFTLNILKKNASVVSLGGGAFLNKNIKNEILENHLSFWLNWNHQTLINRIKDNKNRPLAFNTTNNQLIDLMKKRSNIYSEALYKIDCEKCTKNTIVKKILDIYETR